MGTFRTLKDEILSGESPTLEFKRDIPDQVIKYLKTVSAFANCLGGRIVFGVDTDLSIVGWKHPNIPIGGMPCVSRCAAAWSGRWQKVMEGSRIRPSLSLPRQLPCKLPCKLPRKLPHKRVHLEDSVRIRDGFWCC